MKKYLILILLLFPLSTFALYSSVSIGSVSNRYRGHQNQCRTIGSYVGTGGNGCISASGFDSSIVTIGEIGGKACFTSKGPGVTSGTITVSGSCMEDGNPRSFQVSFNISEWGFHDINVLNYQKNQKFEDKVKEYSVTVKESTVILEAVMNDSASELTVTGPGGVIITSIYNQSTTRRFNINNLAVGRNELVLTAKSRTGRIDTYKMIVNRLSSPIIKTITLSKDKVELKKGQSETVTYKYFPEDADTSKIVWESSNPEVATVTNGKIKALKEGTSTITISSNNISDKLEVIVKPIIEKINFINKNVNIIKGSEYQLSYEIIPKDEKIDLIFKSNDKNIVTINEKGIIKGINVGTTTVTLESSDGIFKDECKVTIDNSLKMINVDRDLVNLKVGGKDHINISPVPINGVLENITWESSNNKVVHVDNDGNIEAVGKGMAIVTVTNGVLSNTITVNVSSSKNYLLFFFIIIVLLIMIIVLYNIRKNNQKWYNQKY